MLLGSGSGARVQMMQHQADAVISQNNPVSAQLYEVLATTKNVRIISLSAKITWAVTQPTNLQIVVTIDGQTLVFYSSSPGSASDYIAWIVSANSEAAQGDMHAAVGVHTDNPRSSLLEGRSVRVQVRITWAVTQPTPLVCRVKYAKIP